jgi:mono/diheme cytochrome c family protein
LFAIVLLSACESLPGKPDPAERFTLPKKVDDFEVLYAQNCSGCHGEDGRGGPARPLNDPVYLAVMPSSERQRAIAMGVSGTTMPGFYKRDGTGLTKEQIAVLADGMEKRWARPDVLGDVAAPPYGLGIAPVVADAAAGSAVYAQRCAACHGTDGRGGERGGSIVDASYLALVSDQALWSAVVFGRTDLGMPDWRGEKGNAPMSTQEIADVVAWMSSHRRRDG